jgi:hypothetical protein
MLSLNFWKWPNTDLIATTLSLGAKVILKYVCKNKEPTVAQLTAKLPVTWCWQTWQWQSTNYSEAMVLNLCEVNAR